MTLWPLAPLRIRSNIIMYNAALSACEGAERWEETIKLLEASRRCFGGDWGRRKMGKKRQEWCLQKYTMMDLDPWNFGEYIRDIGFLALVDVRVRFTKNNLFTSFLFLIMRFGHILRRSERDLQCVFTFLWGRTIFGGKTQTGCWLHPAHVKDSNRLRSWLCTYIVAIASTFG